MSISYNFNGENNGENHTKGQADNTCIMKKNMLPLMPPFSPPVNRYRNALSASLGSSSNNILVVGSCFTVLTPLSRALSARISTSKMSYDVSDSSFDKTTLPCFGRNTATTASILKQSATCLHQTPYSQNNANCIVKWRHNFY